MKKDLPEKLLRFDVLRAVAILSVFFFHFMMEFSNELTYKNQFVLDTHQQPLIKFFYTFFPAAYGNSGVKLFLVISGFLIHYSYLRSQQEKLAYRSFMMRRFWRIYPLYLLVLLFFSFSNEHYSLSILTTKEGLISFFAHVFLLHNLSDATFFEINPSFWSLALEWQFYLLYPVFLWLRSRFGIQKAAFGLLALNPIYMAWIGLNDPNAHAQPALALSLVATWGMWCLGAWLAESYVNGTRLFKVSNTFLVLFTLAYFAAKYFFVWLYVAALWETIIWAIVAEKYISQPQRPAYRWEIILVPVGLCSYSLYLIHQPLLQPLSNYISVLGLSKRINVLSLLDSLPILVMLFLIAYSMYQLLELPIIELGKKWQKKSAPQNPLGAFVDKRTFMSEQER
ncbi:acyltransferase family protein [Tellurirhabdus bombi]|uniref:acyltransferase family protein n=1 Tax=Tellurirhabdus bombi TaxID=2907205 RepID=UPI001F1959C5|nr:acyltransferase [Tellurirhabdus bombi]